ncbi:MAG: hypothetical protein ACK5AN_12070, partial [Planctomyces sp.]
MARKAAAKVPVKKVVKKAPVAAAKARPAVSRPAPAPPRLPGRPNPGDAQLPPEIEMSRLDEQLVGILNRRVSLFLEKMKGVQQPSRTMFNDLDQQLVWSMIERVNQGPLTSAELKTIFRPMLSAGRQRIKHLRVAYLGPQFSFTHQAA